MLYKRNLRSFSVAPGLLLLLPGDSGFNHNQKKKKKKKYLANIQEIKISFRALYTAYQNCRMTLLAELMVSYLSILSCILLLTTNLQRSMCCDCANMIYFLSQ